MKIKEIITTLFFISASLFTYALLPTKGSFQIIVLTGVFFVILPLIFNKFILKKELEFFGIKIGDWKQGIKWSAISLFLIGIIFFIIIKYFDFLQGYSIPVFITESFLNFLFYEFIVTALFVAIYEFYFRGFLLFTFNQKMGYWAILLQFLVFLMLVFTIGEKSLHTFIPYLVCAPFAGLIAYKSRSLIYSGVTQFIILFVLNLITIKMIK